MISTSFTESNGYLDGSANLTPDQCEPLAVALTELPEGQPALVSCFKITEAELEEFQRTGRIWVIAVGTTMPPIHLTAIKPFP